MGPHMLCGQESAGQLLLDAVGVPGPETPHSRGDDDPFATVSFELLQEKG